MVQSPCINTANQTVHVVQSPCISNSAHSISVVQSPQITTAAVRPPVVSMTETTSTAQTSCVSTPGSPSVGTFVQPCTHAINVAQSCVSAPSPGCTPCSTSGQPCCIAQSACVSTPSRGYGGQPCTATTPILVQPSPQIEPHNLFWLVLLAGNISRCQGCGGKIERGIDGKVLPPPNDLVVQHKEQVIFQNPHSGIFQLSRDYRNVYYHPRLLCLQRKFPTFEAAKHIRVSNQVFNRLTVTHKDYLKKEFAIQFSINS